MRLRRLVIAALCLSLAPGCFVGEELDKGMALMDQHSGKKAAAEKKPVTTPGEAQGGEKRSAESWWSKAKTLSSEERNTDIVRCDLPGGAQFMQKTDCLVRGGRAG